MEVKQSVKFTLFSKVISTLIKKYIIPMIDVTILKKKGCFVSAVVSQQGEGEAAQHTSLGGPLCSV